MLSPLKVDRFVVPSGRYLIVDLGVAVPVSTIATFLHMADDAGVTEGSIDIESSNDLSSWTTSAFLATVRRNTHSATVIPYGSEGVFRYVRFQRGTAVGPYIIEIVSRGLNIGKALEAAE